jgi:AAA15 family ATPase/GTPase
VQSTIRLKNQGFGVNREKITIFIYVVSIFILMLIEFSIENFLSFKNEVEFSMVANKDETLKNNLYNLKDYRLKKSVAIFGPNGTGKTNLITAIALVKFLVTDSKDFEKDKKFMEFPFKLSSKFGDNKPIKFRIKFSKNKNIYDYQINISTKKRGEYKFIIEKEKLLKNNIIQYDFSEIDRTDSQYEKSLKKEIEERVSQKNKNKLVLSFIREKNFDKFDEVYSWFNDNLEVFVDGIKTGMIDIEKELESKQMSDDVLKVLNSSSFNNISKLEVLKEKRDSKKLIERLRKEDIFSEKILEKFQKEDFSRSVKVYHKNDLNKEIDFSLRGEESSGTNRFIELLVYIFKAKKDNKVLIVDEIEQNLHPVLLKKLYEQINLSKAKVQLIATTHAYPLLLYVNDEEQEIFRRDQIYFTRLLKDQSTQFYSLINIGGIRKDLKIFKAYFDGRLEAFPSCENE